MKSSLKNTEGHFSGAKLILLTAAFLSVAWLIRDLLWGQELTENQTALLGALLVTGLINRVSARGHFRLRFGRDGAEVESNAHNQEY